MKSSEFCERVLNLIDKRTFTIVTSCKYLKADCATNPLFKIKRNVFLTNEKLARDLLYRCCGRFTLDELGSCLLDQDFDIETIEAVFELYAYAETIKERNGP